MRRLAMRVHIANGLGEEHVTPVQEIAQRIGARRGADLGHSLIPVDATRLFVVTRAVIGVIRSAAFEQPALLGAPEFEAEVVAMAVHILDGPEIRLAGRKAIGAP